MIKVQTQTETYFTDFMNKSVLHKNDGTVIIQMTFEDKKTGKWVTLGCDELQTISSV